MKRTIRIFSVAAALVAFTSTSYAQEMASATATATIITPISITKAVDMNFGNVAVQSTNGGTVILATDGSRTKTDGVTLPASGGTVTAASFTVNGTAGYTYAITLPTTAVTLSSGANAMTATAFNSNPIATGILTSGTQVLLVGATLNVAAAQPAGEYVTGTPFQVTVNYN